MMKKITLLLVAIVLIGNASFSQNTLDKDSLLNKNKFYLHILSFANNKFKPSYEVILKGGKSSVMITPIYTLKGKEKEGFGLETQYRRYYRVNDQITKFKKLYVAPYAFYEYLENTAESTSYLTIYPYSYSSVKATDYITSFGTGIVFGTQIFLLDDHLVIDGYLGGGIRKSIINSVSGYDYSRDIIEEGFSGITLRGGIQIGLVF